MEKDEQHANYLNLSGYSKPTPSDDSSLPMLNFARQNTKSRTSPKKLQVQQNNKN